jgi:hypothetical protein
MSIFERLFGIAPRNQISASGVRQLLAQIDMIRTEILQLVEPGTEIPFECAMFVPNVLAEFNDPHLAIVHGQGTGHAFFRVKAVREAILDPEPILDYTSLVRALRKKGYTVRQVKYFSTR